jgi:hypothetical protein
MTLHRITKFNTEWFIVCLNIISKFRSIIIFRSFVKHNGDSKKLVGISMIFHCTELDLSYWNYSWVASLKKKHNFQPPAMLIVLVFHKNCLIRSFLKVLWRSVSIQILMVPSWLVKVLHPSQKSEVRHFIMAEATELQIMASISPSMPGSPYWIQ